MADLNHKKNSTGKITNPGGNRSSAKLGTKNRQAPTRRIEDVENGFANRVKKVVGGKKPINKLSANRGNIGNKTEEPKPSSALPITKSVDKETTSIDKLMAAGYEWVLPCVKDGDFSKVNDKLIFIEILNKIIDKAKHKEIFKEVKRKYNRYLLDEKKENVSGVIRLINEIKENGYGAVNG